MHQEGQQGTVPCAHRSAPRTEELCATAPRVLRLLQGWDLRPRLAAEGDGDGPGAFASVSMKTSQRTSDGVERQRDERYPGVAV